VVRSCVAAQRRDERSIGRATPSLRGFGPLHAGLQLDDAKAVALTAFKSLFKSEGQRLLSKSRGRQRGVTPTAT
jgi:hypothetical protein